MDSYRLDYLSSHYVDELDMQVAALEIRARRRFQQERNLYLKRARLASTKNIRMPLTPRFISGPSTQSQMRAAHPSSTAGEAL